jgi:hypothetical protein
VSLGTCSAGRFTQFVVTDRAVNHIYDVSPDGQRFLVNTAVERDPAPITVVLNWQSALRQ